MMYCTYAHEIRMSTGFIYFLNVTEIEILSKILSRFMQELRFFSPPYLQTNKFFFYNFINADRTHQTPRSETNDLIIPELAVDTVSVFVPVPQVLIPSGRLEEDQMIPVYTQ